MKKLLLSLVLVFSVFWIQNTNALSPVACTEEAKLCSDWKTWVSRTAPNCEFQECPNIHPENPVMCTAEAKLCSDGKTYVSRTWPNCEFQECPNIHPENPISCTADYTPVCWEVSLQCFKAPCPSKKQTYSNLCNLKNSGAKFLYEWECKIQEPVSCPVFKLAQPPYLCKYHYSLNDKWCKIPKLICEDGISYTMRIKLDRLATKFLMKIEGKFWPETDKISKVRRK